MGELMPHVMEQLYDIGMDFPRFEGKPHATYMLATIPRSGSTYCAIRLWQTGLLGAPLEYLNFRFVGDLFRRLYKTSSVDSVLTEAQVDGYWSDVMRIRTSPNGIFGHKMFCANYVEISKRVPQFLEKITPDYVIYLTRRDVLGQAMSYSRAQRSKRWFANMPNTPSVEYDFDHIKTCIDSIQSQKLSWERAFAITGVTPIRIFYEDLLSDEKSVIDNLCEAMGLDSKAAIRMPIPMIERQTDGISRDWRDRFMRDNAGVDREAEWLV